jgi:hypothetical protein
MKLCRKKIVKALVFLENQFPLFESQPENCSYPLTTQLILNYLRVSTSYFREKSLLFLSQEEQELLNSCPKEVEKLIELKQIDFFILLKQESSFWDDDFEFINTRCDLILGRIFRILLKEVESFFYSEEIHEITQNSSKLEELQAIGLNSVDEVFFEAFNKQFHTYFVNFKKGVIL